MESHKRFHTFNIVDYAIPHYAGLFQFVTTGKNTNWKYVFSISDVIPNSKFWVMKATTNAMAIEAPSFTPMKEIFINSHNEHNPLWMRSYRFISDMNIGVLCFATNGVNIRPSLDFQVSEEEDDIFNVPVIRVCDRTAWIVELNTKF